MKKKHLFPILLILLTSCHAYDAKEVKRDFKAIYPDYTFSECSTTESDSSTVHFKIQYTVPDTKEMKTEEWQYLRQNKRWKLDKIREAHNTDDIVAIGEFVSDEGGSKIQSSRYKIIKTLKGQIDHETISVGYYFYKNTQPLPKKAILHLQKTLSEENVFYTALNHDADKNIIQYNDEMIDINLTKP